ncbi:maleylpyruvate isomerase family mycothiol-dependent enzyme [Aestuariimicrobium kwangyangense]|uniref:maleylpyruvate isomerase family mycothiol-dependent enzyme n=1 Tax=Aestuariimicrobium kwangyangense TaxID=396389 RepID=UPI0003B36629|nr:maleylpyruvate isomerase family mycothiol-dependent enzyme [Aestuariimicrobium kwangyangense]
MDRAAIWTTIHDERRALARDLDIITDEDWNRESWAHGWTIADVVAHLVDSNRTSALGHLQRILAARGDTDRVNQVGVERERRFRHQDLLGAYRSTIPLKASPAGDLRSRLVEEIAHGEDIRRALGIVRDYPLAATLPALQYLAHTRSARTGSAHRSAHTGSVRGGGKGLARGLRLVASDAGLSHGRGPEVRGSALSLMVALSGRRVHETELSGPGRAALLARITPR